VFEVQIAVATVIGIWEVNVGGVVEVCFAGIGEGCKVVVSAFVHVRARFVWIVVEEGIESCI
jgi:hypothetical protein